MPARRLIAEKLSELLSAISHAHRVRIIEELYEGERDVNTLKDLLEVNQSTVSQHLAVLRAYQVVRQRKEGHRVFYRLAQPELARWILDGLRFIENGLDSAEEVRSAADKVRSIWLVSRRDKGARSKRS